MPSRLHRPRHDPPSIGDHYLAHPLEFSLIGALWATLGGVLTAAHHIPAVGIDPHRALAPLPAYQAEIIPILLLASGVMVLTAIFWTGADSTSWSIELYGLPIGITAWAAYGIGATSLWWTILAGFMVAGAFGRWVAAVLNRRDPGGVLVVDGQIRTKTTP